MSWKSLVTTSLLCVLASPAFADPTLTVTGSINNKNASPVRVWNIAVTPDLAIASGGATPMALELGFVATGGNILSINSTGNETRVADLTNPGNPIFGWETTDPAANNKPTGEQLGTGANATSAFAAIGLANFGAALKQDVITITTQSSVTQLAWGGAYSAAGATLAPTLGALPGGGQIAQESNLAAAVNGVQGFYSFSGTLSSLGPTTSRFLGDMNGDGRVTTADTAQYGKALFNNAQYLIDFPNLNRLRGDINGNGALTTADTALFGQVLFNTPPVTGSGAGLSGGSVPEPASLILVGLGLAAASLGRRRR